MPDEFTPCPFPHADDPDLLTVADAARLLRCSELTVARMLRAGQLPGVKVGRSWVIPRGALVRSLNDRAYSDLLATVKHRNEQLAVLLRQYGGLPQRASPSTASTGKRRPGRPHLLGDTNAPKV